MVTLEAIPPPSPSDYRGDLIVLEQFELITNLWAKQASEAGLKTAVGKSSLRFQNRCFQGPTIAYPEGPHKETIRLTTTRDSHELKLKIQKTKNSLLIPA